MAAISHLPFLMAASLTTVTGESEGWRELSRLAATGFQDMTRLAGGNVAMHLDICRTNSDAIINWIDRYQRTLSRLKAMVDKAGVMDERGRPRPLEETDPSELENFLEKASEGRYRWEADKANKNEEMADLVNMPSKKELQSEYTRMFTGGFFQKRRNGGNNEEEKTKKK